jgi:hypothetical protein
MTLFTPSSDFGTDKKTDQNQIEFIREQSALSQHLQAVNPNGRV